jgi:dihydroorotate dehydrogenase
MPSKHAAKNRRREAERLRLAAAVERQASEPPRGPSCTERKIAERRSQPRQPRPRLSETTNALLMLSGMGMSLDQADEVRAEARARLGRNNNAR